MSRWEDYNESKSRLEQWIEEMEQALQENPDTKAELGEMKTLIERYKVITIKNEKLLFICVYFAVYRK